MYKRGVSMCFKQISGERGRWGEGAGGGREKENTNLVPRSSKYTIPRFFSTFNNDQGPGVRRPISA